MGVESLSVIGTEIHGWRLDSMYRLEQGTGMRPNHQISFTILSKKSNGIYIHTKGN